MTKETFDLPTDETAPSAGADENASSDGLPSRFGEQRTGAFRAVPELLRRFGVPIAELLATVGLTAEQLVSGDGIEHHSRLSELLNVAAERTGCPHFGLLVGQTVNCDSLGDVGRLARSAATLGDALRALAAHFHFHSTAAVIWMVESAPIATLHYGVLTDARARAIQFHAGIGAAMCSVVRELAGGDWSPRQISLPFRRPADVSPYSSVLGAPLEFDSESARIAFDSDWLQRPLASADADLHERLLAQFRDLAEEAAGDLECRVRGAIRAHLATDDADLPAVAAAIGMGRELWSDVCPSGRSHFADWWKT